jgi:hypothetical protein
MKAQTYEGVYWRSLYEFTERKSWPESKIDLAVILAKYNLLGTKTVNMRFTKSTAMDFNNHKIDN